MVRAKGRDSIGQVHVWAAIVLANLLLVAFKLLRFDANSGADWVLLVLYVLTALLAAWVSYRAWRDMKRSRV